MKMHMLPINVVTSFSPDGYKVYGHRFLDSFLRHWPAFVGLHVFLEGQHPPFLDERVQWHELHDDPEHQAFCEKYKGPEWNSKTDWNEMSVRFCHKVFAVTSPRLSERGWRVWVDADTIMTADVSQEMLDKLLPNGKALTFLGRRGWMRMGVMQKLYSECGFVGYNLSTNEAVAMLHDMRAVYTTGKLFTLGRHNWHDSYVFDHCRQHLAISPEVENDLSASLPSQTSDPWPQTLLGLFSTHQKGPKRKLAVYGREADMLGVMEWRKIPPSTTGLR